MPIRVEIPYAPRQWAKEFHRSFLRLIVLVLHRRAGKTTAVVNHHQRAALSNAWERQRLQWLDPTLTDAELQELIHPPGGRVYGHCLPTRKQAKDIAWEPLKHYARGIPGAVPNESELMIKYPTGHRVRLFGSDDPDSLRGHQFSGFSFDEYSQQDPKTFTEVVSKALADHLGYVVFCGTIKGKDHLFRTYQAAEREPAQWFSLWQDIDRSLATETGATVRVLGQAMADDRKLVEQGVMTQDEFDQEWHLSTDAAIQGAFYRKEMALARAEGRIGRVPYDPMIRVETWWDLGMDDSTAIWFTQSLKGGEVRLIRYYEASGEGMEHYARKLDEFGYAYGRHYGPHDIAVREWGSGKSRIETAKALGVNFTPVPDIGLHDGIEATRLLLRRCFFDEVLCERGLECLRQYKKRYNATLKEFTGDPVHDQYSHGADAFRTGAVGTQGPMLERRQAAKQNRYSSSRDRELSGGWMK